LFLLPGIVYSGGKDKYNNSDKAREKYMKKLERKIEKQHKAFLKKQHAAEVKKGKQINGKGNHYDNTVK
jgi:hypothetical protein